MTYRYVARDYMGVPRVYGEGETKDIAETRCCEELMAYRQRRPDLASAGFSVELDNAA